MSAPDDPTIPLPPSGYALPAPIAFRTVNNPARGLYPQHRHAWGEFVYAFSGVMQVKLADHHYLAPPQHGIWLPPETDHVGLNRHEASHCSLYIGQEHCDRLPRKACALAVSPLTRALLEHLRVHPPAPPLSEEMSRLLLVVVDQLAQAAPLDHYLPHSDDPVLARVLQAMQDAPGDNRSLAELAAAFHTTERTLGRRCQRDLGISFAEWRQRLRVTKALPRLQAGDKVEAIALDLGYATASAFIAMFRRMTGETPDEYRRAVGGEPGR